MRRESISWADGNGNFWLLGGFYHYRGRFSDIEGYLNDLWKFDGVNWTWVAGDSTTNQVGVYGTKGVADGANKPGARRGSTGWTDGDGNFWLLGGYGYGSTGFGHLNDLWKFDGVNWTWVAGDSTPNQAGVYGTKGVADADNKPGARRASISWLDGSDHLWLFGGHGYGAELGYLNDLWVFEP
jgi:hypothetical protein